MSHNQGSTDQIQFDGKIQFRPGPGPNKISKSRTSDQGQLKFLNVGPYQGRLEYLNSTGPCQQVFENLGLIFVDPFITLFLTNFFFVSLLFMFQIYFFFVSDLHLTAIILLHFHEYMTEIRQKLAWVEFRFEVYRTSLRLGALVNPKCLRFTEKALRMI